MSKTPLPMLAAVLSTSLAFAASNALADDQYRDQRATQDTLGAAADTRAQPQAMRDDRRHDGQAQQLTREDRKFVDKALSASAGSIELARVAEQRARNDEVRQFARTLKNHHQQAQQEIMNLRTDQRTAQARPEPLDTWAIRRLNAIENDREFEAAFAELMVARHQMAIDGLEAVANDQDYSRQVRDLAQQQLGATRQHLQTAQRLDRDVRPVAGADDDN